MKKLSTGPLESMLDQYDHAEYKLESAREELEQTKLQLIQFAVDQNMLDCLTVNVNKLKRMI